jgi:hypothetical protein
MGEMKNEYKIFVRKAERKRSCGRLGHGYEENVKVDLMEIGCEDLTGNLQE